MSANPEQIVAKYQQALADETFRRFNLEAQLEESEAENRTMRAALADKHRDDPTGVVDIQA